MTVVKMQQITLTSNNHKKYGNCTVIPIIGAAGSRSQHFGNIVFWGTIKTGTAEKTKTFDSFRYKEVVEFIKQLKENFTMVEHVIYQPSHYRKRTGEAEETLNEATDYKGELDQWISKSASCCGQILSMDKFKVYYKDSELYIPEGNYSVNVKEKDGKLNFHLNLTTEEPNALWLNLSSDELFHTEDKWNLISGEANYIEGTVYSGGGAHHQNTFIGVFKPSSKLQRYKQTYKGRDGDYTEYYIVTKDLKLEETFEG